MTTQLRQAASPQQNAIYLVVRDPACPNLLIIAVAGSGKTTTLVGICNNVEGKIVFLAFNKKIADEIGQKLIAAGVDKGRVHSGTFHAFGLRAWSRVEPFCEVDGGKTDTLMAEHQVPKAYHAFVKQLVSLSKQAMLQPGELPQMYQLVSHYDLEEKLPGDDDTTLERAIFYSQDILMASIERASEVIDFDDMIYMPLIKRVPFPQYDWVLLDEAQDTNAARRAMAERLLAPNGHLIAVGDPHQAIYGFTGANADALDLIRETFDAKEMPLSVSFRCSRAVVEHAQKIVNHIQPAEWAPAGVVRYLPKPEFDRLTPESTDAILCRVNKPLVELALNYIKRGRAAHVEGRDIGAGLLAIINKWKTVRTIAELDTKLDEYAEREVAKFKQKNEEFKIHQLMDKVDSIRALMEDLDDLAPVSTVRDRILSIFQDSDGMRKPSITLCSVHKSKGREWSRVYLYGRDRYMPHQMAKQVWELEQEQNLIYVAITRAKHELIEVTLEGLSE